MNKLKGVCFIGLDTKFYCTNTPEHTNIPSCSGKLVFDSSRPQEGIFVYTLAKLYNKANLMNGIISLPDGSSYDKKYFMKSYRIKVNPATRYRVVP